MAPALSRGGVVVPIKNEVPKKPILSSDSASVFRAAACVSTSECIIAGGESPDGQALVWLLQGTKLTLLPQSTDTDNASAYFDGAACRGTDCEVVGDATTKEDEPTGLFGELRLHGSPSVEVVDNDSLGYASSVSCPPGPVCWVGGATANGQGAEAYFSLSNGDIKGPYGQPSISGIDGLACLSFGACGAAEIQNLTFGQTAGWVERLNQLSDGRPVMVARAQLMLGIAALNQSYYLAVGSSSADDWLGDLVTAAGKPRPEISWAHEGYLQAISCPVQTTCIAVGFTKDSSTKQPGGVSGVDGAIELLHLRTAPSAPGLKVAGKTRSSVRLRITAPASNGDVAVKSYDLVVTRCKPHHSGCQQETVKTLTLPGKTRTTTLMHLAAKTAYYFAIRAVNSIGAGPYSARVRATP
jgi:fibronectin type III domain protein